jgi:hypothetical protein
MHVKRLRVGNEALNRPFNHTVPICRNKRDMCSAAQDHLFDNLVKLDSYSELVRLLGSSDRRAHYPPNLVELPDYFLAVLS